MIFATGGYASADLKGTYCSTVTGICGPGFTNQNGQSRNNGWYAGGRLRLHGAQGPAGRRAPRVEYQHFDVRSNNAFFSNIAANNYDLEAKGDIVRARLTIKTSGYRFFY